MWFGYGEPYTRDSLYYVTLSGKARAAGKGKAKVEIFIAVHVAPS